MKHPFRYLLLSLFILFLSSSCANYQLKYSIENKSWAERKLPTDLEIKHTMFLIGDAGDKPSIELNPTLQLLQLKLEKADKNSSVFFLGDNIYPKGMPSKADKENRADAEAKINAQLETLKNFKGRILFTPGNHDWGLGLSAVKRQEKYIEKYLNKGIENEDNWENYFLPDRACSGPDILELNDQLVAIIVDTNWWLADWDKEAKINDGCDAKSRKVFSFNFEEALRKYKNKNVVVISHHPIHTYGPHGGAYTVKDHLFPLEQLNHTMIPLPVLGSLLVLIRSVAGTKQDLSNQLYKDLQNTMLKAASKNGSFIFASGHEHSLQYIVDEKQKQIISGSGSKRTANKIGPLSEFAYGDHGFSKIDFYEDGSAWVEFWIPNANNKTGKLIYRQKIKDKLSISEDNIPTEFPEYDKHLKTVSVHPVQNIVEKKGGLHYLFLGKHYRELYTNKYEFPVLDLGQYKGGLKPIKRGGGNQTNSLRLANPSGQQYNMRALTKDASRLLPYPFNKLSMAEDIVLDNFLSTHPFAALAIPKLADAVNIYHTNPKLFYIPKQAALGVHNDIFGNGVYLIEERPAKDWSDLESFGNSKKIISTPDVIEKITKNHKHDIDQAWAVRSRLFDLIIGDWDRHDDQWRWASFKKNGQTTYRPIPRDRDQAFSKYDGLLTRTASIFPDGFLHQFRPYSGDIKNLKWASWSSRYFNRTFTTELTWQDWKKEAQYIQTHLTDEAIEEAFKTWPQDVPELEAEEIKGFLKQRRDKIVKLARSHFLLMAKHVDVLGTDKRERFEITRRNDEQTLIEVFALSKKKAKKQEKLYSRIFKTDETKAIDLYGLDDNDEFIVKGKVNKGPKLRLIGCLGEDHFIDESKVTGLSKRTKIYDTPTGNKLELSLEAKNKTSNKRQENIYDRKAPHYEYNLFFPLPNLAFNPDNGFLLGVDLSWTIFKFKKSPYGQYHRLRAARAFATQSFNFDYQGAFLETFGKWDFLLAGEFHGDLYTLNYFGLGNETINDHLPKDQRDFNRVRQNLVHIQPSLQKRFATNSGRFSFGPFYEISNIEKSPKRFITEVNLADSFFKSIDYTGFKFQLQFENVDNTQMTKRGVKFHSSLSWNSNLGNNNNFTKLNTDLSYFIPLGQKENIVIASFVNFSRIWGDNEFFYSPAIGANNNLRGFRNDRFRGDVGLVHSTDIRFRLFNSQNKIIPFSLGLYAGYDYGRVWLDDEDSDVWHSDYGGGIWISPIDYFIISAGFFRSTEEDRITVKAGFAF